MRRPRGNNHVDFHVPDPFGPRMRSRPVGRMAVSALMVVVGAFLTLVGFLPGVGPDVPLLKAIPILTLSVGLWLLVSGLYRRT